MDKRTLRKAMLERRRGIAADEAARQSAAIMEQLRQLPEFREADAVLVYVASKDNEVDTIPLIESLLQEGRMVLVPVAKDAGRMVWSRLQALDELERRRFGILEPPPEFERPTDPPPGSICLVPGLAFSPEGLRIGYGGGFYDRFLSEYDGIMAGLAFQAQVVDSLPAEPHDVPMDMVITPEAVLRRNQQ